MDRATFHRFYEDTAAALKAYLRLTCKDAALADDVLQEAYLRMLRRSLGALEPAQLKAYLYKTAHSALTDHYRVRQRDARWQDHLSCAGTADLPESGAVVDLSDYAAAGPLELPVDMQRVFVTLTPRQQRLLWLAYVEGFTHDEIAEVVGVSASSVRVLLSRARAGLAAKLGDRGLGPVAAGGAKR